MIILNDAFRWVSLLVVFSSLFASNPSLAAEKTGEIRHILEDGAIVSLGSKDGVATGLTGYVFREESVAGQVVNIKIAELTVTEVYNDSAKIEIRRKVSPVTLMDKVRIEGVVASISPGEGGGESIFSKKWFWSVVAAGAVGTTYFLVKNGGGGGEKSSTGTISISVRFP